MEQKKPPRKPLIFYYLIGLVIIMLLNADEGAGNRG